MDTLVDILSFSLVYNPPCFHLIEHASVWNLSSLVCYHEQGFDFSNQLFIICVTISIPISVDGWSKKGLHFYLFKIPPYFQMFWGRSFVKRSCFSKIYFLEKMIFLSKMMFSGVPYSGST
jgi:hypothetical protein